MTEGAPSPIGLETVAAASSDQVSCELEGEAVILHLGAGVYYGLDPVGAHVWSLLEREHTVAELVDAVVAAYQVDADTARADLVDLLGQMASRGLVTLR